MDNRGPKPMLEPLTIAPVVTLRSVTPGRIRWRVPALLNRPELGAGVCAALADCPTVLSVKANALTGSVLVFHDFASEPATLTAALEAVMARLVSERRLQALASSPAASPGIAPPDSSYSYSRIDSRIWELQHGLAGVLDRHRGPAFKLFAITLLDRLFEALPPALISMTVDSVTRRENSTLSRAGATTVPSQLRLLAVTGAIAWTADSTLGYFRSIASADLGSAIRLDLRNELYRHFQTLDLAQIESELPGYWESVFNDDTEAVAAYFKDKIDPMISIVANVAIVIVQLFRVSFGLAMLQLVMIPGLYVVSKVLLPLMQQRRKLAAKAERRLEADLRANVQGISTIASFAREGDEAKHIEALGIVQGQRERESSRVESTYVPLLQMVAGLGFLGTLGVGGLLVNSGRIVSGELSMIGYSSLRLLQALGYLGVSVDSLTKARAAMGRIEAFRARVPRVQSGPMALPPGSVRGDIELRDVSFHYPDEVPLFTKLSLKFPAGKTIGIVGQSGAGKTTLLKLLLRYYDVGDGEISLDGKPIRSLKLDDLRRSIAYVPQQPFIFPGTIRANIAYGRPDATDEEIARAAALAAADEFIDRLPNGYDTVVRGSGTGGTGQALSGGQAQRLAIARAALANAPVLLFDEATSALDNETEAALQRSLHDFSAGRTRIVVAHRLSMVRRADHIYVLERGAVREEGTHDELVARDGAYAGFWRVQTGEPPAVAISAAKPQRPRRKISKPVRTPERKIAAKRVQGKSVPVEVKQAVEAKQIGTVRKSGTAKQTSKKQASNKKVTVTVPTQKKRTAVK